MLQEYEDILNKMPDHIEEIEDILDTIFSKEVKYSIHTIEGFSRIEFTTDDYFTASGYMETNLLYYCAYAFFDAIINHNDECYKAFGYKKEYKHYPIKGFSDGIDTMHNIVIELGRDL